jgi:hypothetical protein
MVDKDYADGLKEAVNHAHEFVKEIKKNREDDQMISLLITQLAQETFTIGYKKNK